MSKSLKKLIDINRLREFKNKLVGTDSAYVQTAAVDQTIAGTKTFSKPIAGSVTGNAATATKLATARTINGVSFDGSANITVADSTKLPLAGGKMTGDLKITTSGATSNQLRLICGDYGVIFRNDGRNFYLLQTASGEAENGMWNSARPLTLDLSNGVCNINGNAATATNAVTAKACTGNAATATKLATARTIALSGAATGTATAFDGSGNITIPVTALASSAIRAQWYAAFPDGAEAHNAMWGGRDITAAFNNGTVSANIANGTFKDIFPGDYITKSVTISGTAYTVNWVVADCDYWWHKGDQNNGMETHHVVIVPQTPIFTANMNNDNVTTGGYKGSRMYEETIPACATGIVNAFGSSHILKFRDGISNRVDTGAVSSGVTQWTGASGWWGEWVDAYCNLMSEKMVYGAPITASGAMDNTVALRQMSAFRLSERLINPSRYNWWLRDVVSSASFATVYGHGGASSDYASYVLGVRLFALLR